MLLLFIKYNHYLFVEYKKARQEIKRASTDTIRLQKKVKKGKVIVWTVRISR